MPWSASGSLPHPAAERSSISRTSLTPSLAQNNWGGQETWESPVPPSCFELWIDPLVLSDVDQDGYNPRTAIKSSSASRNRVSPHLLPSALLDSCWDFPLHLHKISPCYHFHMQITRLQYAVHWKCATVTLLGKRDDKKVTWSWTG